MKQISIGIVIVIGAMIGAPVSGAERSPSSTATAAPAIHIEDVERFYEVYDAAGGRPSAEQLQRDYIDPGSDGLSPASRSVSKRCARPRGSIPISRIASCT